MGRHGGINILHQKSWHVWRMDNRLRVERDELQYAESERERIQQEHRANFTNNLDILRRRALGEDTSQEEVEAARRIAEGVPPAPTSGELATGPAGQNSSATASKDGAKEEFAAKKLQDKDNSYRLGAVTLCNLKQAERDLADTLKKKKTREVDASAVGGRGYWGAGAGNLGSGPHINLFEDAELAVGNQHEQHAKQMKYLERNNELLEKSQKRPISEFDEIISDVPWYARTPTASSSTSSAAQTAFEELSRSRNNRLAGNRALPSAESPDKEELEEEEVGALCKSEQGQAGRSGSGPLALAGLRCLKERDRRQGDRSKEEDRQSEGGKSKFSTSSTSVKRMKWTKSHGQNVLRIINERKESESEDDTNSPKKGKDEERGGLQKPEQIGVVDCYPLGDTEDSSSSDVSEQCRAKKQKKEKKRSKRRKEESKEKKAKKDKKDKKDKTKASSSTLSLEALRSERERRERMERGRADRVLRGKA